MFLIDEYCSIHKSLDFVNIFFLHVSAGFTIRGLLFCLSSPSPIFIYRTNPGERWRALLQPPGIWTYGSFNTRPDGEEVTLSILFSSSYMLLHSLPLPSPSPLSPPSLLLTLCPQGICDPESCRRNKKHHQHIRGITRRTRVTAAENERDEGGI